MILSVVYHSYEAQNYNKDDVQQIVETSRSRNFTTDITGVLVNHDGQFIQLVEGPAHAIDQLIADIGRDRRHHGMTILYDEAVQTRTFSSWRLGYLDDLVDPEQLSTFERLSGLARAKTDLSADYLDAPVIHDLLVLMCLDLADADKAGVSGIISRLRATRGDPIERWVASKP